MLLPEYVTAEHLIWRKTETDLPEIVLLFRTRRNEGCAIYALYLYMTVSTLGSEVIDCIEMLCGTPSSFAYL